MRADRWEMRGEKWEVVAGLAAVRAGAAVLNLIMLRERERVTDAPWVVVGGV
jgi:hypothetical protein